MGNKTEKPACGAGRKRLQTAWHRCAALFAVLVLLVAPLGGCLRQPLPPKQPAQSSEPELLEEKSGGVLKLAQGVALTQEQQELLLGYMDAYYGSLAALAVQDASALYAEPNGAQAVGNSAVWEYLVGVRSMQKQELTLARYRYIIVCQEVEEREDGSLKLYVTEQSVQNFTAYPGINAECVFIPHSFILTQTERGWRIGSHMQLDSLYFTLFGDGQSAADKSVNDRPWFTQNNAREFFPARVRELLAQAKENLRLREAALEQHTADASGGEDAAQAAAKAPAEGGSAAVMHPYNRTAAVAYALRWVGYRNTAWPDYGWQGGNCQNYVSQCVLAGGIPMDTQGDAVWKWFDDVPDNTQSEAGRSASWSGVGAFREYLAGAAEETGVVGTVDAPFYSGQPGDLLDFGEAPDSGWRHTVMITGVMQDENGGTVDYLVSSNTADLRNFPASAYIYTYQSLVTIAGWSE